MPPPDDSIFRRCPCVALTEVVGTRAGDPISAERQAKRHRYLDRWQARTDAATATDRVIRSLDGRAYGSLGRRGVTRGARWVPPDVQTRGKRAGAGGVLRHGARGDLRPVPVQ